MAANDQSGSVTLSLGHSTFTPNEDEPRSRFRLGFVLGLLVGVLATLLLVPKTGEETREQVKEITTVLTRACHRHDDRRTPLRAACRLPGNCVSLNPSLYSHFS